MSIIVPLEGRPTDEVSSDILVGTNGNAFIVIATTAKALARAGAGRAYVEAYRKEATSGDYDHVLQTSIAYLDAEPQGLGG